MEESQNVKGRFGIMRWELLARSLSAGLAFLIWGCGEGGSGTSSSSTALVTPTPTPTPVPTYASAADFSRDRSFNAIGLKIVSSTGNSQQTGTLSLETSTIGFDYTAATRNYTVRYNGDTLVTGSLPQQTATMPFDYYSFGTTTFYRMPTYLGVDANNQRIDSSLTGYTVWTDSVSPGQSGSAITRYMLYGARTVAGDIPVTGMRSYTGSTNLNSGGGNAQRATFTVDFTNKTVTGSTVIYYTPSIEGQTASFNFVGTLDPMTGRISGTLTTGASGSFEGALYGAGGSEIAILFYGSTNRFYGSRELLTYGLAAGR